MKKRIVRRRGFTLIELVMIIIILGILALVALPQYYNLTSSANSSSESGVLGGVRAGISTYFSNYRVFPSTLDSATDAACTTANACFGDVLSQGGITSQWTRVSSTQYTGPAGTTYSYTSASGSFQ